NECALDVTGFLRHQTISEPQLYFDVGRPEDRFDDGSRSAGNHSSYKHRPYRRGVEFRHSQYSIMGIDGLESMRLSAIPALPECRRPYAANKGFGNTWGLRNAFKSIDNSKVLQIGTRVRCRADGHRNIALCVIGHLSRIQLRPFARRYESKNSTNAG